MEFDRRHPNLQWLPNVIAILFLGVTGTALAMNFVSPTAGLSGYLLGLVTVDFGMVAVAVMAWIIGRKLWREDHDPRYLAAAIGFAGLPVWGVFETVCVSYMIPALSLSLACTFSTDYAYIAIAWLILVPLGSVLWDFWVYLETGELARPSLAPAESR